MGAVTVVIRKRSPDNRMLIADVTFSGTYGAGGDTYTNAQFEVINQIDAIIDAGTLGSATTAYALQADLTNKKLKLFNSNGAAPAALLETSTGNQAATVGRVIVYKDSPHV
jgi:hypothetical protein